jgi:hypothetical protein
MLASRNRQFPGDSVDHDLGLKADHRLRRDFVELSRAQSSSVEPSAFRLLD